MAWFFCSECRAKYEVLDDETPTGLCEGCNRSKIEAYETLVKERMEELVSSGKFEDAEARQLVTHSVFNEIYRGIVIEPVPTCKQCGCEIVQGAVCQWCCRE